MYVGQGSVTLVDRRLKYVDGHSAYFPYTAGELARIYLSDLLRSYEAERICDHYKVTPQDAALMSIQAPLYFNPDRGREGTFVYVDINACYWQLWHRHALNLAYDPSTGVVGAPRPAFRVPEADWGWLRAEKELRNAMFGMMASHEIGWYVNGKFKHFEVLGRYSAPGLAALVKTQLRQIARVAVEEFGCRMWLTDAGIFSPSEGMAFQCWLGGIVKAPPGLGNVVGDLNHVGTAGDGPRPKATVGSGAERRSGPPFESAAAPHLYTERVDRSRLLVGERVEMPDKRAGRYQPIGSLSEGSNPSGNGLHLSSSVKAQGHGHLWGLGDYRVGNLITRGPKDAQRAESGAFSNL